MTFIILFTFFTQYRKRKKNRPWLWILNFLRASIKTMLEVIRSYSRNMTTALFWCIILFSSIIFTDEWVIVLCRIIFSICTFSSKTLGMTKPGCCFEDVTSNLSQNHEWIQFNTCKKTHTFYELWNSSKM